MPIINKIVPNVEEKINSKAAENIIINRQIANIVNNAAIMLFLLKIRLI